MGASRLTVDAILVVQSEIYRGSKNVVDLEVVLPHAFGIANADFSANEAHLAAATNVFVGITRTRELLALALRRDLATDALLAAAGQQGAVEDVRCGGHGLLSHVRRSYATV